VRQAQVQKIPGNHTLRGVPARGIVGIEVRKAGILNRCLLYGARKSYSRRVQ